MKKANNIILSKLTALAFITMLGCMAVLSSCTKDETGIPAVADGTPTITKIYLLDTIPKHKDSVIVGAEPYKLIAISGTNIGGVVNAYINGYKTFFNPTYNTNSSIVLTIPGGVPTDSTGIGAKFGKIILETTHGIATIAFQIIAKPAVYSTDKITFGADRGDITLKGKNFGDVTNVVFSKTTTAVKIVSKTKDKLGNETMTLRFPTSTIGQTTLDITNSSGTITTKDLEFVNADVALKIFTEGFEQDWSNNSWGDAGIVNSDQAYAGKKSMSQKLAGGNYHLIGFNDWYPSIPYSADYTHITFAIKGGVVDTPFWIESDASSVGFGQKYIAKNAITVPAKIWSYYKIPLKDLDFWSPGKILKQIAWQVKGIPAKDDVYYFDDVMLIHK
jgi:hypothetical protein